MDKVYLTKNRIELKDEPLITTLSFSGGKQSSVLLWMVLKGMIERPKQFYVLNADPGMENCHTYTYVETMKRECEKQSIPFITVPGPSLYKDLLDFKPQKRLDRIDNPPYWTLSDKGTKGRLFQKCTPYYKIMPMRRYVRSLLEREYGIKQTTKRLKANIVETWIGFSYSEVQRMKPPHVYYTYYRYPLIEMKMDNSKCEQFFKEYSLPMPPRSVCNACFANGLQTLKEMYENRPEDYAMAVNVDNSLKGWKDVITRDEVFVSQSMVRLEDLPAQNFLQEMPNADDWGCDSGFCFV